MPAKSSMRADLFPALRFRIGKGAFVGGKSLSHQRHSNQIVSEAAGIAYGRRDGRARHEVLRRTVAPEAAPRGVC